MKRIALSLLAVLALGAPAKAIVGGPWDNNLFYSPSLDGTFQGTLSGKNISGVMLFSSASAGTASSSGGSSISNAMGSGGVLVSFVDGEIVYSDMVVAIASTHSLAATIETASISGGSSALYPVNGFMTAKFDNIYPSITFKGKADLVVNGADSSTSAYEPEHRSTRVRGIKTSSQSSFRWDWTGI